MAWRLDRIARSTSHPLQLAAEVSEQECELVSLTEGIDTRTPGGRLVFAILAAVAQMERDLTAERTKAAEGRAAGKPWGPPTLLDRDMAAAARRLLEEG